MLFAHISDLHIDYKDKKLINEFERLIRNIHNKNADHLIITGDLVHNPEKENYHIIKMILNKYGFWDDAKLTVTIGNHEIFGGAEKTHTFPYQCKYTNYYERLENFLKYFINTLPERYKLQFPFIKQVTNKIILIIINSVAKWSSRKNPIGSNGNVDFSQLRSLENLSKENKYSNHFKIAVIHHHLYYTADNSYDEMHRLWLYSERDTMVMHNYRKVLNFLNKNKINLTLHGHTHYTNLYEKDNIKIINSSGCLKPLSRIKKKLYTLIDINEKKNKLEYKIKFAENN